MHWGEFCGKEAADQSKRILILAESHHIDIYNEDDRTAGVPASCSTESVIREKYYADPTHKNFRMFDKIVCSFGIDPTPQGNREAFWEKVYFGNYIDVLCGVGDDVAEKTLTKDGNRKKYNDDLFRFINDHGIDAVFCFSRLVYKYLPSLSKTNDIRRHEFAEDIPCGKIGKRRDYIGRCKYLAGTEHDGTEIMLQKDLSVFGMRHPSARGGFSPEHYAEYLQNELPF